ncbi:MAG: sulfatase, partial [Fibrobacteres bacterium]|nr:sulfatase [Fibrobacterota bacterium]
PCELVDVLPTLLDVAGVEIPDALPGFSLRTNFHRIASFAEFHGRGYEEYQRSPAIMWRTKEWKLILYMPGRLDEAFQHYENMKGELYNLKNDPLEMDNLYAIQKHSAIRDRMISEVLMHIVCSLGRFPSCAARTKIRITGEETKPDRGKW